MTELSREDHLCREVVRGMIITVGDLRSWASDNFGTLNWRGQLYRHAVLVEVCKALHHSEKTGITHLESYHPARIWQNVTDASVP